MSKKHAFQVFMLVIFKNIKNMIIAIPVANQLALLYNS